MKMLGLAIAAVLAVGCSGGPASVDTDSLIPPPDGALELIGHGPVTRPVAPLVVIRPSREIQADENAMRAHREAAAEMTAATDGQITFRVSADEDASVILFSRVDGAQGTPGVAGQQPSGSTTVTSGSIVFQSVYYAGRRPIVTHEIMHWLGMPNHSSRPGDIMYTGDGDPNRTISAREIGVVRYLLTLAPGAVL
jgi:hypothetical protein